MTKFLDALRSTVHLFKDVRLGAAYLAFLHIPLSAWAQPVEPTAPSLGEQESLLKVDDFSPSRGKWSINTGLSYQATDRGGYIPSLFFVTGPGGAVVAVPSISESTDRSDRLTLSFGARYAATDRVNLSATIVGSVASVRTTTDPNVSVRNTEANLDALNLGLDFRFISGPSRSNVTGFVSVAAVEEQDDGFVHGRSVSTGLTFSRVVDPLILSASVVYNHFSEREGPDGAFDPGNVVTFTPTIGFAVNPDINISWGMGISYREGNRIEGRPGGDSDVLSTLNLGLSYRLSQDSLLTVNGRAGVGGNDAVELSLGLSRRF